MKPTLQTTFGLNGNCLLACLASIMEIDIETIPYTNDYDDWQDELNKWLIDNHNIYLMSIRFDLNSYIPAAIHQGYTIGCGKSCNNLMHAVVCFNKKIIHDPLPNSGLTFENIEYFDILIKFFPNI